MQLSNSYDLFLALAYLPCAQCSYDIGNCEGGYLLTAKSDMLLFVK